MKNYLKLMRVHHYIKNLLVFAALVCSGKLFDMEKLISGIAAFLIFCMVSSIVYIVNDVCDSKKDKNHPTKCKRPIAAGTVSPGSAWILAAVLFIIAAVCNCLIFSPVATALLILYFAMNIAYSFGLKNVPLVDITILVAGFLIRILYGAIVTNIAISNWLYLTVIAMSFYFALGKRRNELRWVGDKGTRQVLKAYPIGFLDKNMVMCMTLANVFYALWSVDKKTIEFYNNQYLIFTVPIVMLITMKYSLDIEGNSVGDPVEVLFRDKVLIVLCAVYLAVMFMLLYL